MDRSKETPLLSVIQTPAQSCIFSESVQEQRGVGVGGSSGERKAARVFLTAPAGVGGGDAFYLAVSGV